MSDLFECQICQKLFTGPIPYSQHLGSEKHKKKAENPHTILTGLQNGNNSDGLVSTSDVVPTAMQYACQECGLVCSGPIPYQQHLRGTLHLKRQRKNAMLQQLHQSAHFSTTEKDEGKASESSPMATEIDNKVMVEISIGDDVPVSNKFQVDTSKSASIHLFSNGYACRECSKTFTGSIPYQAHLQSAVHQRKLQNKLLLQQVLDMMNKHVEPGMTELTIETVSKENDINGTNEADEANRTQVELPNIVSLDSSEGQNIESSSTDTKNISLEMGSSPDVSGMILGPNSNENVLDTKQMPPDTKSEALTCSTTACCMCSVVFTGAQHARDHYTGKKHQKTLRHHYAMFLFQQSLSAEKCSSHAESTGSPKDSNSRLCSTCDITGSRDSLVKHDEMKASFEKSRNLETEVSDTCNDIDSKDTSTHDNAVKSVPAQEIVDDSKTDLTNATRLGSKDACVDNTDVEKAVPSAESQDPHWDSGINPLIVEPGCAVSFFENGLETFQHVKSSPPLDSHISLSDLQSEEESMAEIPPVEKSMTS